MNDKIPNFFIVGAAKAGTSAIHAILQSHPQVFMSPIKEPNYFSKDISIKNMDSRNRKKFGNKNIFRDKNGEIISAHQRYVDNGKDYLELFKNAKEQSVLGEASVSYLYSKVAAEEIYKFNPDAKILIVLRNPVDRAFSHYLMDLKVGRVSMKENFIDMALRDYYDQSPKYWGKDPLYLDLGMYYNQVKRYFDIFPKKNLLLINYENFKENNLEIINVIYDFLNLEKADLDYFERKNTAQVPKNHFAFYIIQSKLIRYFSKKILSENFRKSLKGKLISDKNKPILGGADKQRLVDFYKQDMMRLQTDLKFNTQSWI